MSLCPIGVQTGIIQLAGPITITQLNDIKVNGSPFTASFAPRTTAPTLVGNVVNETSDNTILYKGIKYQLIGGVQICTPTSTGYQLPGRTLTSSLELIIPFVNLQVIGTYPTCILLIVPIYNSSFSFHAGYLQQLINTDTYPAAALQTVFFENEGDTSQVSMAYNTCIDMSNAEGQYANSNMRCYYFPEGINLTGQDFQTIQGLLTQNGANTIPSFFLPPVLLNNGMNTVTAFTISDVGQKIPTETSTSGTLYLSRLSISSSEFTKQFQYFDKPIALSSSTFQKTCPYYTTQQYKCTPFNRLRDLSGNMVVSNGATLEKILQQQDSASANLATGSLSTADMGEAIGITAAIIAGIGIFTIIGKYFMNKLREPPST